MTKYFYELKKNTNIRKKNNNISCLTMGISAGKINIESEKNNYIKSISPQEFQSAASMDAEFDLRIDNFISKVLNISNIQANRFNSLLSIDIIQIDKAIKDKNSILCDRRQFCLIETRIISTSDSNYFTEDYDILSMQNPEACINCILDRLESRLDNYYSKKIDPDLSLYPLIFTEGAGGVFVHEIIGHFFEIDNFFLSPYKDTINKKHKAFDQAIFIYDNPSLDGLPGSYSFDDRGNLSSKTLIISNGLFTGNLIGGNVSGASVLGSLRRESFQYDAIPRMSNLIIRSSEKPSASPLSSLDRYILVKHAKGGNIIPSTGQYTMYIDYAEVWESGKLIGPAKPLTLKGSILDLFGNIHVIDNKYHTKPVKCLKKGQLVYCTATVPSILLYQKI